MSAALLGLLAWRIDLRACARLWADAEATWVVLLLASMTVERLLGTYRWLFLLRAGGIDVAFAPVARILYASNFLGMFLPGGGVELARVVGLSRSMADGATALASVLLDRLLGVITLLLFSLVSAAVFRHTVTWALGPALLALVAVLALLVSERARRLLPAGARKRLAGVLRFLATLKGRLVAAGGLAFLHQGLRVVTVACAAHALSIEVPLGHYLVYVPLIFFAQLLPVSVGGLGVREAAFVYFFGAVGVDAAAAFSLSLLIYAAGVIANLPGAWFIQR